MSRLPPDLVARIERDFAREDLRIAIDASLDSLWDGGINVGAAQLARAIVFLADGDMERFEELRADFCGDPRDLLMNANSKLVNRRYWFSEPFDQMGPLRDA